MDSRALIEKILRRRGVCDAAEMAEFLSDSPRRTYDPFCLKGMEEGIALILTACQKRERICIYGDYDADGITATTLMLSVLGHLTQPGQVGYYIPSRFEEGYGLHTEAIQQIHEQGFDVMITVDCGSVSAMEVAYAKALGLKVLVTDHHNVTDVIADCVVINPRQPGCPYPFKHLAGVGVAFKVAQALQQRAALPKSVLTEVLDLAAIGTVGDVMSLLDENRTIVKFGMKVIDQRQRAGLAALMEGAGLHSEKISTENISFVIVPHLNASGRMEDASKAVELLRQKDAPKTETEKTRLSAMVDWIIAQNTRRKRVQQETYDRCIALLQAAGCGEPETVKNFVLILAEDAHEGIAGIVAGKIKDTYYRPAVIVTPSGEDKQELKGTGRSIADVDLYALLKESAELFSRFGGHAGACGFLMKRENLQQLEKNLLAGMAWRKAENPQLFQRKYDIDAEVEVEDMTVELAEGLARLAPFGCGNPRPLLQCRQVTLSDMRYMGEKNQHMRFVAHSLYGTRLQCVLFQHADRYPASTYAGRPVRLIGTLECQVWQGMQRLQFLAEEIAFD